MSAWKRADPTKVVEMFTIYEDPVDWPKGTFVVRRFEVSAAGLACECFAFNSLENARRALPPGLAMITRHPSDEPQIVEVWL